MSTRETPELIQRKCRNDSPEPKSHQESQGRLHQLLAIEAGSSNWIYLLSAKGPGGSLYYALCLLRFREQESPAARALGVVPSLQSYKLAGPAAGERSGACKAGTTPSYRA